MDRDETVADPSFGFAPELCNFMAVFSTFKPRAPKITPSAGTMSTLCEAVPKTSG
jgi:hypothetical protein